MVVARRPRCAPSLVLPRHERSKVGAAQLVLLDPDDLSALTDKLMFDRMASDVPAMRATLSKRIDRPRSPAACACGEDTAIPGLRTLVVEDLSVTTNDPQYGVELARQHGAAGEAPTDNCRR